MKKGFVLFVLFFPLACLGVRQSVNIDSLKDKLAISGKERVRMLMNISYDYVDSASYNNFVVGCLKEALDSAVFQKNDSLQIDIYNYLGLADYTVGKYESATSYYYTALNLLGHFPAPRLKAKVDNNLGLIFDELEDYKQSLSYYKRAYEQDRISNNEKGNLLTFINLGIVYQNLLQYDSCRYYNEKAYRLAEKYQDSTSLVNIINNLGTLEYDLKNYSKGLDYYNRALQLYTASGDREGIAYARNNIGLIHLDEKEYPQAFKNFKEALKIAEELDLYEFSGNVFSNLSIYYKETGDYKNAYDYYDKCNTVYDSLAGEKENKMIRKLQVKYQSAKRQRDVLQLQKENLEQKEMLSSTKMIQHSLYFIILLVVVFLAILFFLLRKEKILARELQEKTEELKKLNVAKDRFFSIIAHDLKNPFNALVGYTSLLRSEFDSFTREELNQIVTDLSNATEQGFSLLENLLHWTRSQTNRITVYKTYFKLRGVVGSVASLAAPSLADKSQEVQIDIDDHLEAFADKDMIETVLRNLIFNSIKFSYPNTTIRVEAKRIQKNIQISVIDQGIGIDAEKQHKFFDYEENTTTEGTVGEKGSGLGLVICREFVEKNGGLIWVESELGKGATFRFTIPYVEHDG